MRPARYRTIAWLVLGAAAAGGGIWLRASGPGNLGSAADGRRTRIAPARADLGPAGHNCRFWALVGQGYSTALLEEHLIAPGNTTLRTLGGFNRDGWGFASYPAGGELRAILDGPLVRRGRPPSDNPPDPNFDRAVGELVRLRPRAILGHVRTGTTGHWGVPDPHPFLHRGLAFAHNGGVSTVAVEELIEAEIPGFLAGNPPEYVRGYVDSEIYFLWLLCHAEAHPELSFTEAIREAVQILYERVAPARLNFVLTRGDTLWAARCAGMDAADPVRYFPGDDPASPFWVVASQPVGAEGSRWGTVPPTNLGVFVPGRPPVFHPVAADGEISFSIRSVRVAPGVDEDGDGHCRSFAIIARPDASFGHHPVRLRVLELGEEVAQILGESERVEIQSGGDDSLVVRIEVAPPELSATVWNLTLELLLLGAEPRVVATAGPGSDPSWGLAGLRVEGSANDAPGSPPPPPPLPPQSDSIGRPYPNPARGEVSIPLHLVSAGAPVTLWIWNARGALIREEAGLRAKSRFGPAGAVETAVRWDGRTNAGGLAPAGIYFARVRAGDRTQEHRIVLAR